MESSKALLISSAVKPKAVVARAHAATALDRYVLITKIFVITNGQG